jgi:hypothetical protein
MNSYLLVAIIAAALVGLFIVLYPDMFYSSKVDEKKNIGYASSAPVSEVKPRGGNDDADYNDYLQGVALDSSIKEQHNEWLDNLQINLQPRMYSIRDDCDTSETKRWGLLKIDYGNSINENQNISIPSGRTCTEGDGGNSRFGGYGIGLCPVQRDV